MIASTFFLYAATAFTLFSSATAATNITSATQFFDSLPACIKACGSESQDIVKSACGDDFECLCKLVDFTQVDPGSTTTNSTSSETTDPCFLACSTADQDASNAVLADLLTSCIPYISELNNDNATSPNATTGNNSTNSTGVPVSSPSANAGASLVMGSLLVVALPAVLSGLFL